MKLFLIRHGQTTGDIEDRYGGDYDDHLTVTGRIQATKLAVTLLKQNIETLYYSPLLRAKETALIIQNKLQCTLALTPSLRERNKYGILTGMIKAEAEKTYPELTALVNNDENTINGAESYDDFRDRIVTAFNQLLNLQDGNHAIGIITHGGPIKVIMREIFGQEIKHVEDCGYIEIRKQGNNVSVTRSEGILFSH